MYVESWDEFARQAEALFLAEPNRTRCGRAAKCSLFLPIFAPLSKGEARGRDSGGGGGWTAGKWMVFQHLELGWCGQSA